MQPYGLKHFAIIGCTMLFFLTSISAQPSQDRITYACAPCGCQMDTVTFLAPGDCPSCHMPLMPRYPALDREPGRNSRLTAAILLFERADIMDVTGPWSVFEHAGFRVITVAPITELIQLGRSMHLKPDFTLDACPDFDVLVIPGGGPAESHQDSALVVWIQNRYKSTDALLSVCSGAFYLGAAGLLDGQEATTFASLIPDLAEQFPFAIVRNDVKYTDNGKILTSAGLSSGMDASFGVVAHYYGAARARDIANHMEYDWDANNHFVRSQLADNYLSSIRPLVRLFAQEYLGSEGDRQAWEYQYQLTQQIPVDTIVNLISVELEKIPGWNHVNKTNTSIQGTMTNNVLGSGEIHLSINEESQKRIATLSAKRLDL